jgi:hypothetical protein
LLLRSLSSRTLEDDGDKELGEGEIVERRIISLERALNPGGGDNDADADDDVADDDDDKDEIKGGVSNGDGEDEFGTAVGKGLRRGCPTCEFEKRPVPCETYPLRAAILGVHVPRIPKSHVDLRVQNRMDSVPSSQMTR